MLPFSLCNKTCNSVHEQTPLSNDTTDSVLWHREVGRAKDLISTPRMLKIYIKQHKCRLTMYKSTVTYSSVPVSWRSHARTVLPFRVQTASLVNEWKS
jgi:hypothetical protein